LATLAELERKVQVLEDTEAIRKLKAKYWYSVDNKLWDSLADCYAEDVVFESPHLGKMQGRDFIVKVLKRAMKNVKTAHHGHNPEIDITDEFAARGRWALNDRVEMADNQYFEGRGSYEEEYVKQDGCWKIKNSKLTYIFQENFPGSVPSKSSG
jgi:ketosteroid isomerase-like protein